MNQHKTLQVFIPYEIAIELRDKGFNENCLAMYDKDMVINHSIYHQNKSNYGICSAPTYCQAIDWIFDKLCHNEEFIEIVYAGSKPRAEIEEEIRQALKLI